LPDRVIFHYTLRGEGELIIGSNEIIDLTPNTLAIIPPGLDHCIQCGDVGNETGFDGQGDPNAPLCELTAGPIEEATLIIACGRIQVNYAGNVGLFDHLKEVIVLDYNDSPRMRNIFESLIEEYRLAGAACAAMMSALMNQCLIEVLRKASEVNNGCLPWLSALDDPRLSAVINTIIEHPEQPHTLDSLADIAHMSRSTFIRHFERCFDRTPIDYLRDVRLRRGAQLLQISNDSMDGIASKIGFASRSHFSHAFQEQYGCSPMEFRKQCH
jgi:AraC-like DNA-binding protein